MPSTGSAACEAFLPGEVALSGATTRARRLGAAAACALGLCAPAAAATPLAAVFHLDEGAGALAGDASLNANHGSLLGPDRIAGRFGGALRFRGADNGVRVQRSPTLEPQRLAVEAWVRSDHPPTPYRYIVSQGASECHAASYGLYSGSSGGLAFYVSDGVLFRVSPQAAASVWDGAWHHVAGTYDGARVRLHLDGVQVGDGTPATLAIDYDLPSLVDHYIGAYRGPCPTSLDFDGDIDEVRSWSRPLGPEEIAASAAMGHPSVRRLATGDLGGDAIVYTSATAGGDVRVSLVAGHGGQRIASAHVEAADPAGAAVSCSAAGPACDLALSNGGRTARIALSGPAARGARLRVLLASGASFAVDAALAGVVPGPEGGLVPEVEPNLPPPGPGRVTPVTGAPPIAPPAARARPRLSRVEVARTGPSRGGLTPYLVSFRVSAPAATTVRVQRGVRTARGTLRFLRPRTVMSRAQAPGRRRARLGRLAPGLHRYTILVLNRSGRATVTRRFVARPAAATRPGSAPGRKR